MCINYTSIKEKIIIKIFLMLDEKQRRSLGIKTSFIFWGDKSATLSYLKVKKWESTIRLTTMKYLKQHFFFTIIHILFCLILPSKILLIILEESSYVNKNKSLLFKPKVTQNGSIFFKFKHCETCFDLSIHWPYTWC